MLGCEVMYCMRFAVCEGFDELQAEGHTTPTLSLAHVVRLKATLSGKSTASCDQLERVN